MAVRSPIRLFLVDDHEVILDGMAAMLAQHQNQVEIVGRATSKAEAEFRIPRSEVDVVLLDIRLGDDSGLDLGEHLLAGRRPPLVVFFTTYEDEAYLFRALRIGANGFLSKRSSADELIAHLQRVIAGEVVVDSALAGRIALSPARLKSGEFWPGGHLGLTQRESETLGLMVKGLSNRAIASQLFVSEETVKSHVSAIYRKLEVPDRAAAVALSLREGLYV